MPSLLLPQVPNSPYSVGNHLSKSPDFVLAKGTITYAPTDPYQTISFTVNNTNVPHFNKDFRITLFETLNNVNYPCGMVNEATVTILPSGTNQPAGAVDQYYNPDYGNLLLPPAAGLAPEPGADGEVYGLAVQSDDRTVIVGDFTHYKDSHVTVRNGIARLKTDGSLDTSFSSTRGGADDFITSLVLTNNQIYVGGGFAYFDGTQRNGIARLNSNGTLDTSFNPQPGANGTVWAVAVQTDGKVIIGGEFTLAGGTICSHLARLNTDGSLDYTFNPGVIGGPPGAPGYITNVNAVAVTPAGIVIGGNFTSVGGQSMKNIARLSATDGSLDTSFNPTGTDDQVFALALQSDGHLLIGGAFTNVNGSLLKHIARLNTSGSVDTKF